jgi:hypothetical protein
MRGQRRWSGIGARYHRRAPATDRIDGSTGSTQKAGTEEFGEDRPRDQLRPTDENRSR